MCIVFALPDLFDDQKIFATSPLMNFKHAEQDMSQQIVEKINKLEVIKQEAASDPKPTPILFIHGAWHGAWCWENFLPYFAERGYNSYAVSLRGHAGSEGHSKLRWSSVNDYVQDVASVVDSIGATPILVGHSMGGAVVQKYLEKTDCKGAVLLASVPPSGVINFILKLIRKHPLLYLKSVVTTNLYHVVSSEKLVKEFCFSEDIAPEKLSRYFNKLGGESFRALIDLLFLNLPNPEKVNTPILVLGAEQDRIFKMREVEKTAAAYNTTAEFFPIAHDMMLEEGWQGVADRMIAWLQNQ